MRSVLPSRIAGEIRAPSSKSVLQRVIFAAALSEGTSRISFRSLCDDCGAALRVVSALGANTEYRKAEDLLIVTGPISGGATALTCGEAGLSFRMLCPIVALFEHELTLTAAGSLQTRPMAMIEEPLRALGARCSTNMGYPPVKIKGPLRGGPVELDGSGTSQFLSGLLFALPKAPGESRIVVRSLKSTPYVRLTLEILKDFGVKVNHNPDLTSFDIQGNQSFNACDYTVDGDWSSAASLLVAGAIAGSVTIHGLSPNSEQADRAIIDLLRSVGARIDISDGSVSVEQGELRPFSFNAEDCPDLFPVLAVLACNCEGTSEIQGVHRLRHKESDRGQALLAELGKLGAELQVEDDTLVIKRSQLQGGKVSSHGDHRIAMACALAALNAAAPVVISEPQVVSKSYPGFFEDLEKLQRPNE